MKIRLCICLSFIITLLLYSNYSGKNITGLAQTQQTTITGCNPSQGSCGTMVQLTGTGIDMTPGVYKVEFNMIEAQIVGVQPDGIYVKVPQGLPEGLVIINIYINGKLAQNCNACFIVGSGQTGPPVPTQGMETTTIDQLVPTPNETPTPEATATPAFTLDKLPAGSLSQGKIVYSSWEKDKYTDDIYTLKPGGKPVNLTKDRLYDTNPSWSPDGKHIVFTSLREGNLDIYTMTSDGKNIKNITKNPFVDDNGSWSPRGDKIVFNSDRDGNLDIYVINIDGRKAVNLTKNGKDVKFPSWSPDGSKIAFSTNRDGNYEIYSMKSDGSSQGNITKFSNGDELAPKYSPDGKKIIFFSNRDGNDEIYIMNANGSGQVNLSNNPATDDRFPCWSPDGKQIAYMSLRLVSNDETYWEICSMNSDGSKKINITNNTYWDGFPDWTK